MGLTIPVAHDFSCSWCYLAMVHARRLRTDFGAAIDWRPYELYPEGVELPGVPEPIPTIPNRPLTLSRTELAFAAESLVKPTREPALRNRTRRAHLAVEFAKQSGSADEFVERIYRAYWLEHRDIESLDVLTGLAKGLIGDLDGLKASIEAGQFESEVVPFGGPAHQTGVYNLPTFWIGSDRYAERPYADLAAAVGRAHSDAPYASIEFPGPPEGRPYVAINMVATIDGKTVSGTRTEDVMDLGSKTDHQAMRNLEAAAEAVLIGGQTLRSTPKVRYDPALFRIVVSRTGGFDFIAPFFTDRAIVVVPESAGPVPERIRHWRLGQNSVDLSALLRRIRTELGVTRLLCEGGSELNGEILAADLADELFLTIAPKVRLGRDLPTYAGGEPLAKGALLGFELATCLTVKNEIFLRYRRRRDL